MKKLIKVTLILAVSVVILFALFLIYAGINDYKPEEKTTIYTSDNPDLLGGASKFSLITWNIGYCGQNKETDFFYDGGKNIRPSEEQVKKNLQNIKLFLQNNKNTDFILLQEVDKNSKRSYYINEFDSLSNIFPLRNCIYGKNYDVFFVPSPPHNPTGKINGGLMTISKYIPKKSVKHAFPENYSQPVRFFMPDECFLVNRYKISNEKELLIINTHNSIYDNEALKVKQTEFLRIFLKKEYKKGNYIVAAGDWNRFPPGFIPKFKDDITDTTKTYIPKDYLPEWKWLYDNKTPTNRRIATPYKKGETPVSVTDFILLSPNIKAISVKNINLGFKHSDHQPVKAVFKLK